MERFSIDRQAVTVSLFGMDLILAERTTQDYKAWEDFLENHKDDLGDSAVASIAMLMIIQDGLKPNVENLKPYQIYKRWKLKRLFTPQSIIKKFTLQQIDNMWRKVREMEGWKPDTEPCSECGQPVYKKKVKNIKR